MLTWRCKHDPDYILALSGGQCWSYPVATKPPASYADCKFVDNVVGGWVQISGASFTPPGFFETGVLVSKVSNLIKDKTCFQFVGVLSAVQA